MSTTPVIVILDVGAAELAGCIKATAPGAEIHGYAQRLHGHNVVDVTFESAAAHLQSLFGSGRPIVGICAAGILIRALAPVLGDKTAEPPVIAVAGDGSAVVPLLGGHHGANALAAKIADALNISVAMTTASDVRVGIALDEPPPGWRLADSGRAKDAMARIIAGAGVSLDAESGDAKWLDGLKRDGDGDVVRIAVTHRSTVCDADLTYHPPVLTLGVGCERNCDPAELRELAMQTLVDNQLSASAVACVTSIDLKADEAAVHALATHLGVQARFFPAAELEEEAGRLENPSDVVFQETGCHGVAEGAALRSVGRDGNLIVGKAKSRRATCAVGLAPRDIDSAAIGRARGRLAVVGIGPGQAGWRTPEVTRLVSQATDVVGYGLYLDLLGTLTDGKTRHHSELAEEEIRVRKALDLAAEGRSVALVCSGDAGIYALATLVFELLDREDRADWNRVDIAVSPGVSAIQAAAARIGAPIGHDFCTVSLSDLLTPWPEIIRRLKGAAKGDFVVALYNPVSKRRRHQIETARDILLAERPAETPVVLARNLGRPGEVINVIRLGDLTADSADMLTLVLIGNSQSRLIERGGHRWVYTPRGYAAKMPESDHGDRSEVGGAG